MRGVRRSRTDYPDGIVAIYDNDGQSNESADRYTVVFYPIDNAPGYYPPRVWPCVFMSGDPSSAGGVYSSDDLPFRPTGGWQAGPRSAGKTIAWDALPADAQRAALEFRDFDPEAEEARSQANGS